MSRTDFDLLSTTPPDEPCAQTDDANYHATATAEGIRYMKLLRESLGAEPVGSKMSLRRNPHDYGSYITVVYFFDDDNEEHWKYMHRLEEEGPQHWEQAA